MSEVNIKDLIVAELKANGLDIAEDVAVSIVKVVFGLVPKIVLATDNKVDDLLIAVLPIIEAPIMAILDKIDGKED